MIFIMKFCFNSFTYNDDVQEVDLDTDNYLLSFLYYKNQSVSQLVSRYFWYDLFIYVL